MSAAAHEATVWNIVEDGDSAPAAILDQAGPSSEIITNISIGVPNKTMIRIACQSAGQVSVFEYYPKKDGKTMVLTPICRIKLEASEAGEGIMSCEWTNGCTNIRLVHGSIYNVRKTQVSIAEACN